MSESDRSSLSEENPFRQFLWLAGSTVDGDEPPDAEDLRRAADDALVRVYKEPLPAGIHFQAEQAIRSLEDEALALLRSERTEAAVAVVIRRLRAVDQFALDWEAWRQATPEQTEQLRQVLEDKSLSARIDSVREAVKAVQENLSGLVRRLSGRTTYGATECEAMLNKIVGEWNDELPDRPLPSLPMGRSEADVGCYIGAVLQALRAIEASENVGHDSQRVLLPPRPSIIALGDRRYQLEGGEPIVVSDSEDTVLQAFLESGVMDDRQLSKKLDTSTQHG
jgi:hypothetical protein